MIVRFQNYAMKKQCKRIPKVLILRVVITSGQIISMPLTNCVMRLDLRGYAQNNPVVEYQAEGFRMFNDMIGSIEFDVTRLMMKSTNS